MKLAIVGSRTFSDYELMKREINPSSITEIVSGGAAGADTLAERYAREFDIPLRTFPADWNRYGAAAGPKRNTLIVDYCDGLVAFWDGVSKGTNDSVRKARLQGKQVKVVLF